MFIKLITLFVYFYCVNSQETVKVSLYYESLCPYSEEFINEQLYPAYQKLGDVLTLDLVPVGKVKNKHGKIIVTCQHGPKECIANEVQACVLRQNFTQQESMNFVGCITLSGSPETRENARKCARNNKLSWKVIKSCITGEKGKEFLVYYANITANLKPELKYVPHIIFNDKFDETEEENARKNFLQTVCELFQTKPEGC